MLDNVQDVNKPLVCALQLIREKTPRSFFFSDLSADPARFHIKEKKKSQDCIGHTFPCLLLENGWCSQISTQHVEPFTLGVTDCTDMGL